MSPGDLAIIKRVPDQPRWVAELVGRPCVIVKNLTAADGVYSSGHMWDILIDGKVLRVHRLDLEVIR
jgi:hypothetical protein